jgi:hypothetical protein
VISQKAQSTLKDKQNLNYLIESLKTFVYLSEITFVKNAQKKTCLFIQAGFFYKSALLNLQF